MQRFPSSFWLILVGFLLIIAAYRSYIVQFRTLLAPKFGSSRNSKKIAAFGDSLTEGLYDWPNSRQFHPYTDELQRLINERIIETRSAMKIAVQNHGVSGERLRKTMKKRMKEIISTHRPDYVIILAGTNDLLDLDKSAADSLQIQAEAFGILNDLQTLHLYCHYKGIQSAVLSIPETAIDERGANGSVSLLRRSVNKEMYDFVKQNKTKSIFVDIATKIPRRKNRALWDDGVHLSPKGYDLIGQIIYKEMQAVIDEWLGARQ